MATLPDDPAERKAIPAFSGTFGYFAAALIAVAKVSQAGNKQHHDGAPLHWDRSKSSDHEDSLVRHLIEGDKRDTDGHLHAAKVAWRALARLQVMLERLEGAAVPSGVKDAPITVVYEWKHPDLDALYRQADRSP